MTDLEIGDDPMLCHLCGEDFAVSEIVEHFRVEHGGGVSAVSPDPKDTLAEARHHAVKLRNLWEKAGSALSGLLSALDALEQAGGGSKSESGGTAELSPVVKSDRPPDDFWRDVPCGHPPDPIAWHHADGTFVCHCGSGLDPAHAVRLMVEAPGPVTQCGKCGCHVALVSPQDPAQPKPPKASDEFGAGSSKGSGGTAQPPPAPNAPAPPPSVEALGQGEAESGTTAAPSSVVKAHVPHLERAEELLWQAGHPAIAEALGREVRELAARSARFEAVLYPPKSLNREQRRALDHGDGLRAQLDEGPRQGG